MTLKKHSSIVLPQHIKYHENSKVKIVASISDTNIAKVLLGFFLREAELTLWSFSLHIIHSYLSRSLRTYSRVTWTLLNLLLTLAEICISTKVILATGIYNEILWDMHVTNHTIYYCVCVSELCICRVCEYCYICSFICMCGCSYLYVHQRIEEIKYHALSSSTLFHKTCSLIEQGTMM